MEEEYSKEEAWKLLQERINTEDDAPFDFDKVEKADIFKTFDEWDKEWEKKHPVRHWVDTKLFKGRGLFGYSASHALMSPHVLIADLGRQIKWAWQRVFRGWDDRISWSIDYYLDENLPLWIERLKKYSHGVPGSLFKEEDYIPNDPYGATKPGVFEQREEEWGVILQKIADGFRTHKKFLDYEFEYDSQEWHDAKRQFEEAMYLFKEYYDALWD